VSEHPLKADHAKAQEYLQKAMDELGYASASDIPEISIVVASTPEPMAIVEFVSLSVSQALGISITPEPIEFGVRDARIISGDYDMLYMGWGVSSNDPAGYIDVWANNLFATGWPEAYPDQHSEYSAIIDKIKTTADFDERAKLILEAEQFVLQKGPFITMSFSGDTILRSSKVKDFNLRAFGALYDYVFATVEG
jgi:oligopeptide transport system substrate-binding protein